MGRLTKRLLIHRLGSLGDTIVALPCFHLIERAFPDHERLVLTNFPVAANAAPLEALLLNGGFIDGCVRYPVGTRDVLEFGRLFLSIRRLGITEMVYLTDRRDIRQVRRDAAFFRLCGIRRFVGLPESSEATQLRVLDADGTVEHEAQRLLRLLGELGTVDLDDPTSWDLRLTADEKKCAELALEPLAGKKLLAVSVGTKWAVNDWGHENWLAFTRRLSALHGGAYGLVMIGAALDRDRSEDITQAWGGSGLNLCGALAPRETAALLDHCAAYVGHDSGPMHLAASRQVPCVGLFGNLNPPGRWFPYGSRHRPLYNANGVRAITVDDVVGAADALLERG